MTRSTTTRFYRGLPGGDVYIANLDTSAARAGMMTLDPRYDLGNLAQSTLGTPFGWGSKSVGASRLAIALLADALDDERTAVALFTIFRDDVIARMPASEPWMISDNVVRAIAASISKVPA